MALCEAFKLHIIAVLSTEKWLGRALGPRSVITLDTCQKDMMAKAMFTLIVFGCCSQCLFFLTQVNI